MSDINYTAEQEALISDSAPLNLAKAREIGQQIGKSYRSVIAKAKNMGVEYVNAAPARKRPAGMNKAAAVGVIAERVGLKADDLLGLEAAKGKALANLLTALSAS